MDDYLQGLSFATYVLPRGKFTLLIGRAPGCDIIIADNHISGEHICLVKSAENDILVEIKGKNGAFVGAEHLKTGIKLRLRIPFMLNICNVIVVFGIHHLFIHLGDIQARLKLVEFDPFLAKSYLSDGDTCTCNSVGNHPHSAFDSFTPTVRKSPTYNLAPIELDMPPARKKPEKQPVLLAAGPALTMAVPILLGSGRKIMIIAGFIAAMWASANVLYRRNRIKREEIRRRNSYREYVNECEAMINERYIEIRNTLTYTYPGIEEYMKNNGNVHLLWNRKEALEDKYYLRIGIGDYDFPVEIKFQKEKFTVEEDSLKSLPKTLKNRYQVIKNAPICIDLKEFCQIGVVTNTVKSSWDIAYSLILQLAMTLRSEEIKICLVSSQSERVRWMNMLPHTWLGPLSLIANPDSIKDTIRNTLTEEMLIVTVTDSIEAYNMSALQENNCAIFITDEFEKLPIGVQCILHENSSFSGLITLGAACQNRRKVLFDRISRYDAMSYCKRISAISDHIYETIMPIPDKVLLTDLIEGRKIELLDGNRSFSNDYTKTVLELWNSSFSKGTLPAPIGKTVDNETVFIDLDEKMHGPHALLAGTTGSGKSELLQTLILSLAINFPPERICFFLIDYKGGGMANAFEGLPHLAGSISNLSGSAISRAFVSVKSEIEYRQRCFANAKVNSIKEYERVGARPVLPHIVIIIDEFAELKREEPDFLSGLVSVAQVGRSLGVHLILATQKPAGTVDDKIWSNSRLRICLKVRDKMDSNDMLHRPDAAYITNVGRAFMQVGNDELFMEFQCAYSAAPLGVKSQDNGIYLYDEWLNRIDLSKKMNMGNDAFNGMLQIDLLKNAIQDAFRCSNRELPRKLWLDELPSFLVPPENNDKQAVLLGMYDDPERQSYGFYYFDPEKCGNTIILGIPGSGKSSILMRILAEYTNTERKMDIYILDFGGKRLDVFNESRLCGGYISVDEWARSEKLIRFLADEIKSRQSEPEKVNSKPKILVIIDNYASMTEYTGTDIDIDIVEMLRISRSCGVVFIISANNVGTGELPMRIANLADTIICLSMRDKYSYASAFSVSASAIPTIEEIPGRGLVNVDKRILGIQFYLPVADKNENQWKNIITCDIKRANTRISHVSTEYPYVPEKPSLIELSTFLKRQKSEYQHGNLPVGYVEDTGRIFTIPLTKIHFMLIGGRARSGRKNTLKVIEFMANLWAVPTYQINTLNEIYELIQKRIEGIALCSNLTAVIDDFYSNNFSSAIEKSLCEYIDSMNNSNEETLIKIVGVVGNKDNSLLIGRKIWSEITDHPYGIIMGGCLDEQNIFDFSFMSYNKLVKRKRAGMGSVGFYEDEMFCGNVVIPEYDVLSKGGSDEIS